MATKTIAPKKPGPTPKYPWDKWLTIGKKHTLVKGTHFTSTTKTMIIQIYTNAKQKGVKVHVRELAEGKLRIEAYEPEPEKSSKTRRK